MNLLELQQRANILVQKVNEYEASLVGTEIEETETLNQHKYADLYCLRPVMKLLFGKSVEDRLNRTLDNDVDLRAISSSAPALNSSFNLLSFNPDGVGVEVGFKTTERTMTQNIDMMNNHNMLQLDVLDNLNNDRKTRIEQGINYTVSSNIQDALVTESQVANIFKWNSTSDELIMNNTLTVNRQVPGIVTYYLGNDYRGKFTATIPYNPRQDTINAVNYETPASYGSFYSKNQTKSQVPEDNAGACRIFMTGCNYTRGKLESPQQIWQPDAIVGDDNIGIGYNWQGQAVYHELVFKNRRTGSQNVGVDFVPALDTVADNDPQGLATRLVLAQQKPYYYNRPWFDELDSLYGANTSKLVDYIKIKAVTNPEVIYEYNPSDAITLQGNLTVTDDYNLSGFTSTSYVGLKNDATYLVEGFTYYYKFTTSSDITTMQQIVACDFGISLYFNNSRVYLWNYFYNQSEVTTLTLQPNTEYLIKVDTSKRNVGSYPTSYITISSSIDDGQTWTQNQSMTNTYNTNYAGLRVSSLGADVLNNIGFLGSFDMVNSGYEDLDGVFHSYYIKTEVDPIVFDKSKFVLIDDAMLSDKGILTNLNGSNYATISGELTYDLKQSIPQEVVFNLPVVNKPKDGAPSQPGYFEAFATNQTTTAYYRYGFGITLGNDSIYFNIFSRSSRSTQWIDDYSIISRLPEMVELRVIYSQPTVVDNDDKDVQYNSLKLQAKIDNIWEDIYTRSQVYLYLTDVDIKFGQYTVDRNIITSMDLSPFKITADLETVFEASSIMGVTPMNDEQFYKNYKLDYETYAKALDQPL